MKQKLQFRILIVLVLGLAAVAVLAGFFPSFGGSNNNTITYNVSWKGSFDTLTIDMTGTLSAVCRNPGGNEAPGQNQITIEQYDKASSFAKVGGVKSHTFHFPGYPLPDGTGGELAMPSWDEAGCPNPNWDVSRVYGVLTGTLDADANGRVETFSTECFYDSAVKGEMDCTIFEG